MEHTQLFFDDSRVFGRAGTTRVYGTPVVSAVYRDPDFSTDYCSPWVLRRDGAYIMLYMGVHRQTKQHALLAAVSEDGLHFSPLDCSVLPLENRLSVHEIMPLGPSQEPLTVLEDPLAPADEHYRLILTDLDWNGRFGAFGSVLSSPDLIRWHETLHEIPGFASEPVGGAVFNREKGCTTILHRRTWGNRDVGCQDTVDFCGFSDFELCMRQDSLDAPLDEIYGMPAFPYAGMYVGFPCIYADNKPSRCTKFNPGNTYPQLAYSWDAHHWQRSLRQSFLPEYKGQPSLFWLTSMQPLPDGRLGLYAAHSDEPHGVAFRSNGSGTILIYTLRRDGFIGLRTDGEAVVTTREFLYRGGPVHVNLNAAGATCAVLDSAGLNGDVNVFGDGHPVPGFDHVDCVPFSGDSTDWTPDFAGGSLDRFRGRTILIEVRYTEGTLWSISGDLTPLTNTEAARYRTRGFV
ncbi:MAG: hypothetical protein MJ192_04970 [Clostridia bacterium]|nr:hypothetical protein [Clostridia bacterium]